MKKIIALTLTLMMLLAFAGCGEKFICDFCQEETSGSPNEVEIFGKTGNACDDCYDEINEGVEKAEEMVENMTEVVDDIDLNIVG